MGTETLDEAIRRERAGRQWSQEDLAREAGVTRLTVSSVEGGRHVPTLDTVTKILAALGIRGERAAALLGLGGGE